MFRPHQEGPQLVQFVAGKMSGHGSGYHYVAGLTSFVSLDDILKFVEVRYDCLP